MQSRTHGAQMWGDQGPIHWSFLPEPSGQSPAPWLEHSRQALLLQAGTIHSSSILASCCSLFWCVFCGCKVTLTPRCFMSEHQAPDPESCPTPGSQMLTALPQH